MQRQMNPFFVVWLCTCVAIVAFVGVFNAVMDPYLLLDVPRIVGINARKPAADRHERMMKPYDVIRSQPKSLLLGSSRVNVGLDARHPAWPLAVRPVYNLGLQAGDPYMAYRFLQHVITQRPLELVVMGLDFETFLTPNDVDPLHPPEYESRLAVTRDGTPNNAQRQQHVLDLLRTLSLSALTDSAATLTANLIGESHDLVSGNLVISAHDRRRSTAEGSLPFFTAFEINVIRGFHQVSGRTKMDSSVMLRLQSILDLCESRGTRVILFITPVHADQLEIIDKAGLSPLLEQWKRELTALTARYPANDRRGGVLLWDFNGYDRMSTESVPPDRRVSKWYWEPTHYKRAVGDAIVARIFGGGDAQFGTRLTPDNIEPQLAGIRRGQREYRERQPADSRRIRALYDMVAGDFKRARF